MTKERKVCSVCSNEDELRPYGKEGSLICFDCMTSCPEKEAEAKRQFASLFKGGKSVVIDDNGPRLPTYEEAVMIMDILESKS